MCVRTYNSCVCISANLFSVCSMHIYEAQLMICGCLYNKEISQEQLYGFMFNTSTENLQLIQ